MKHLEPSKKCRICCERMSVIKIIEKEENTDLITFYLSVLRLYNHLIKRMS